MWRWLLGASPDPGMSHPWGLGGAVPEDLDLSAYLLRIGVRGELRPDLETLRALHLGHATSIPFENLDIQMGLPIPLDLASLQAKLVRQRRGGYCFEQNTLFLAVLKAVGFEVIACEARVRLGTPEVLPRTHMMLVVRMGEGYLLCDVGFGGEGLLLPVPLDGAVHTQFQNAYRVHPDSGLQVLQSLHHGRWGDLYAFQPEPRFPVDFAVANHYTSTHPESRFVTTLTAQLPGTSVRRILRNRTYTELSGDHLVAREVVDTLRQAFGIIVPEGAVFRALAG